MHKLAVLIFLAAVSTFRSSATPCRVRIDLEQPHSRTPGRGVVLKCVECIAGQDLRTEVTWTKNNRTYTPDSNDPRVQKQLSDLIFRELLISDEGHYTCSNGSMSQEYVLYAKRIKITQRNASLNHTIGESFAIPSNMKLGENTARTDYIITIFKNLIFHNGTSDIGLSGVYQHNKHPAVVELNNTFGSGTYRFDSRNLTLFVQNFSNSNPLQVSAVEYVFYFYTVIPPGFPFSDQTTTFVIPGFRPPLVVQNLRNVTLVNVGDSYQFTVIIESHPSPGSFKWMLNGAKIVNGTANFRVANPTHNSDRSTYSLMIMNISRGQLGTLQFEAGLVNSYAITQTRLVTPVQLQQVDLINGCRDVSHGEGQLNFLVNLSSTFFSELSPLQSRETLRAQLVLNWSQLPERPDEGMTYTNVTTIDVSDILRWQWMKEGGGRKDVVFQLAVDRKTAVPAFVLREVSASSEKRFRVQAKLSLNGTTAAEWSPECESPIFQPCLDKRVAEVTLRLEFSSESLQCSRYTAIEVKGAIQTLLEKLFHCDGTVLSSVEEYHCNQIKGISTFRANLISFHAEDRVKQFYSYLKKGDMFLFNKTVSVKLASPPSSPDSTVSALAGIVGVVIALAIATVLVVIACFYWKKIYKQVDQHSEEEEEGRRQGHHSEDERQRHVSGHSPTRSASPTLQTHQHNERSHMSNSISQQSMSSLASSIFLPRSQNPNVRHNSAFSCHPQGTADTQQRASPSCSRDLPSALQVIDLEEEMNFGHHRSSSLQLHDMTTLRSQDSRSHLTAASGSTRASFSERELFTNRIHHSRAESIVLGDDMSLGEFEPRQGSRRNTSSIDVRATPSSGYQSQCSGFLLKQERVRQRHLTESPQPRLTQLQVIHLQDLVHQFPEGGPYVLLHGVEFEHRQRTCSASQLEQPVDEIQPSDRILVQPASPRSEEADEIERAHASSKAVLPRSRENMRLPLTDVRTVVASEVLSPPHQRLADSSVLGGCPRELELEQEGGGGEQFLRQDTQTSSEVDTSIL